MLKRCLKEPWKGAIYYITKRENIQTFLIHLILPLNNPREWNTLDITFKDERNSMDSGRRKRFYEFLNKACLSKITGFIIGTAAPPKVSVLIQRNIDVSQILVLLGWQVYDIHWVQENNQGVVHNERYKVEMLLSFHAESFQKYSSTISIICLKHLGDLVKVNFTFCVVEQFSPNSFHLHTWPYANYIPRNLSIQTKDGI